MRKKDEIFLLQLLIVGQIKAVTGLYGCCGVF
jgi:hypothetical protein